MKQLFFMLLSILSAAALQAQDVITLKSGEAINGKVSEIGVNEVKYYKATNLTGPVYVTSKNDVAQILYANGSTDVFGANQLTAPSNNVLVVPPQQPQTVIIQQPARSYRYRYYNPLAVIVPHIDLGHIGFGHRSYNRHGRHH